MKKFTRAAAAAAIAAGMAIGVASPASAQINPVLPDFGSLMPGMGESAADKEKLGSTTGAIWSATMFKQVTRGVTVTPGGLVTTRIEIIGNNDNGTKVREIADIMPQGFELVSVTRMKQNALGEALHVVPAEDRTVVPVENGLQEVRLSWTEGGFLGLFEDNPTVSKSNSVVVDFTYRAPQELGQYQHGGFLRVGSLFGPTVREVSGGTPITVENSLPAAFGSLGSS
ncbi:hypothetical protein CJ204_05830 [Corynebacterium xerosis]|uniref:Uncharacterized protein n=1 Tax=Corynebacterium xerosis TaxID=1725 RepID=A0A2N6SZ73_9CORY|nr:hypothetical protein [Corynebacterium xerosis]PMC62378.1 hypothetical protein CJ204_05830 [Corynebacterium xerosis]